VSQVIAWIAAAAESGETPDPERFHDEEDSVSAGEGLKRDPASSETDSTPALEEPLDRNPDLRVYRGRTSAMLRLYLRYSLEAGRLPSLMGSEYFRTRVTCYTVVTFEDRVVFIHDMESCLKKLTAFSKQIILHCVLQGHDRWEAARLLQCNEKTIRRQIPVAIDELSEILLKVGLLEQMNSAREKSCQEGKRSEFSVSDCDHSK